MGRRPLDRAWKKILYGETSWFSYLRNNKLVGFLLYEKGKSDLEIIVFEILKKFQGYGTLLLNHLLKFAKEMRYKKVHLMTTNDNLDALRFYQKKGFIISGINLGVVMKARELKPSISETGDYGIPVRDEILLEYPL